MVIGIVATKSKEVYVWKLSILPILLLIWYMIKLIKLSSPTFCLLSLILLLISAAVSFCFSAKSFTKTEREFYIIQQGTYTVLITAMLIFGTKYYCGYMQAVHGESEEYTVIEAIVSAISSGILTGRMARAIFLTTKS